MLRTRDWRRPPRMAGGSPTDGQSALQDPGLAPRSICANPAEMPPTHPDTIPHHLRRSGQAPHHQLALRRNPNRVPAKPRVCAPQARHTRSHAKPAAHCFIHICLCQFLMSTEPVGSTSHNVHSNHWYEMTSITRHPPLHTTHPESRQLRMPGYGSGLDRLPQDTILLLSY